MPLAIELAANRIGHFTPEEMLARLDQSLTLLIGGPRDQPNRMHTLRAAIAWSENLLSEDERQFLYRVSVFAGGFTREDVDALLADDGATSLSADEGNAALLDCSLIQPASAPRQVGRFSMLETVREYGLERLEASGGSNRVHATYARIMRDYVRRASAGLSEPQQLEWLERIEGSLSNLRAALKWALDRQETAIGLSIVVDIGPFWVVRDHVSECLDWLTAFLALPAEP